MLRKLRIKFVCVTMAIVTLALSVIFGMVLHFTRVELRHDSDQLLRSALDAGGPTGQPFFVLDDAHGDTMWSGDDAPMPELDTQFEGEMPRDIEVPERVLEVPYFVVWTTRSGEVAAVSGNYSIVSVGDRERAGEFANEALQLDTNAGILVDSGLRFLKRMTPGGSAIAFVDATRETETTDYLLKTCLLIGISSWLALFLLTLLCARWAVRPVEQAWHRQTQFVSDASHELNTPLTVITTNAELLASMQLDADADAGADTGTGAGADGERVRTYASNILSSSRQMGELVRNLLELARADNGSVRRESEMLDLSTIVFDAVLPFEPVFYEKSLQLSTSIEENLRVKGSAQRLCELVGILLDNAHKYSSAGGMTVVRVHRVGRSKLQLEVANDGEPIPADQLQNLFQRFYRSDAARTAGGGYGLGLSIAQAIAEEHDGRIWAESAGGTNRFIVELPCA